MDDAPPEVTALAALVDPVRRRLYDFVSAQADPVSRDQAAVAVAISRSQAKFHLDRLEADGLLESDYARLTGRTGPGAGRPAKRYRAHRNELSVTIPARDYGLAALLMADAITEAEAAGTPITPALEAAAAAHGSAIGESCAPGSADALDRALFLLTEQGYQPSRVDDTAYLTNCPFHRLARSHPELVCRMNHALIAAIIAAAVGGVVDAQLDPGENRCCVTLIVHSTVRPEQ